MSERKRGDSAALLNLHARWSEQYPLDDSVAAALAQAAILWRQHRLEAAEKLLFRLSEELRYSADGSLSACAAGSLSGQAPRTY